MGHLNVKVNNSFEGNNPRPGYYITIGASKPTHCKDFEDVARLVADEYKKGGFDGIALSPMPVLDRYALKRLIARKHPDAKFADTHYGIKDIVQILG